MTRPSQDQPPGTQQVKHLMCDGIRTLKHILADEIGICNHGIICPEELRPPSAKGGKLSIIVAVQLICYNYTIYIVIVVINAESEHHVVLLQITQGLLGCFEIIALLPWL